MSLRSFLRGVSIGLLSVSGMLVPLTAHAQTAASTYTFATRYDIERRVTGTIAPDPDGAGVLKHAASRNTYDVNGRLVKVEKGELTAWQSEAVAPASWAGFSVFQTVDTYYDLAGRRLKETVSASGIVQRLTQYSYDSLDRVVCTDRKSVV